MKIHGFLISIVFAAAVIKESAAQVNCSDYESNIVFYGFKDSVSEPFISTFNEPIEDFGCGPKDNVSIIVHGWLEGLNTTAWVNTTIVNLLKYTKGCVIFTDYSTYSKNGNYFGLVNHYDAIAKVLTKKLLHIGHPERIFMYGFSFGARLTVESAIASFNGSIERIELCDPAGPGFDGSARAKVPTLAGKNVACIDTSTNYGTNLYNCHQNFRMGNCGSNQAAHGNYPKGSHGLCPYMYNYAFDYDFVPSPSNNYYGCSSNRLANLTSGVKMGFLGNFNRTEVRGDIFILTAGRDPYIAVNFKDIQTNASSFVELMKRFENLQYKRRDDEGDLAMVTLRSSIWDGANRLLDSLELFVKDLAKSTPYQLGSNRLYEERLDKTKSLLNMEAVDYYNLDELNNEELD